MIRRDLRFKALPEWALLGSLMLVAFLPLAWPDAETEQSKTLQNLQTAYNSETNAYVRYLTFAERAQEEEYGEVASLFRAAACAEHVHLRNLAAVIRKMGAEPAFRIDLPVAKTTAQNLETSGREDGAYERRTMYPEFIEEAKAEGIEDAVRTFQYALTVEVQHFKLFKAALDNLNRMTADSHLYYVCNTCGYTSERPAKLCPGCGDANATYEEMF